MFRLNKLTQRNFYTHLIIILLCVFLLVSITKAQNTQNFSGVWELDLEASGSIDDILKAQGKSRLERRVAKSMSVTQTITQTVNQSIDNLNIHIKSIAVDNVEDFPLNNKWTLIDTAKMGKIQAKNYWINNNTAIVTEMKIQAKNEPALMKLTRTLSNDNHIMQLHIELILNNGKTYRALRIFKNNS